MLNIHKYFSVADFISFKRVGRFAILLSFIGCLSLAYAAENGYDGRTAHVNIRLHDFITDRNDNFLRQKRIRTGYLTPPISDAAPFLAITPRIHGLLADPAVSIEFSWRYITNDLLSKWENVQLSPHIGLSDTILEPLMIAAPADIDSIEFMISHTAATFSSSARLTLDFFSPGDIVIDFDDPIQYQPRNRRACPQPAFVTRSGWGCPEGQSTSCPTISNNPLTHLVLHHTVGTYGADVNEASAMVSAYHDSRNRGYCDIAYNWLIGPSGTIYEGRGGGDAVRQSSYCCANENLISAAMFGDFTTRVFSTAYRNAVVSLFAWRASLGGYLANDIALHASSNRVYTRVFGHRDGNGLNYCPSGTCATACPGNNVYNVLQDVRDDIDATIAANCTLTSPPNSGGCPSPSNDYCGNAIEIPITSDCQGFNYDLCGATRTVAPIACAGYTSAVSDDVWFVIHVPSDQEYNFGLIPSAGLDAVMDLRQGSCSGPSVGCSDNNGGEGAWEAFSAQLVAGNSYYLRIYDFSASATPPSTTNFLLCAYINNCQESAPAASISTTATAVCPGSSVTLAPGGGSLGTGASWKWYSGSCGGTSIGSGNSITASPTANTTYYLRAEGTCNTTSCVSRTISVLSNSTAASSASASNSTVCPGSSTTLSLSGGSLGTGAVWRWYAGNCGGSSIGHGSSITVSPSTTTTYYVRAEGSCNTTNCRSVTVNVRINSTAASSASASSSTICPGGTAILSPSGGSLGTGAVWRWYAGSCGGSSIGHGNSITVSPTTTTTYYVRAEGTCNATNCGQVTVTVRSNSVAAGSVSTSESEICAGGSATLSLVGGSLGTGGSWRWYSGSCGGTSISSGTSLTVNPTTTTTYYVRAEGTCNTTICRSKTIAVNTLSSAPTSITSTATSICSGSSVDLSVNGGSLGSGGGWRWYNGSCGNDQVGSGSSITVQPTESTTYYVHASGTCNTTPCVSLDIGVEAPSRAVDLILPSSNDVCSGTMVSLSFQGGSLSNSASWQWYASSTCGVEPAGSGTSIVVSPTVTTYYSVRAEGGCGTSSCSGTELRVQSPLPAAQGIIQVPNRVCAGEMVTLYAIGDSTNRGSWHWYSDSCGVGWFGSGDSLVIQADSLVSIYLRSEDTCGWSSCVMTTLQLKTNSTGAVAIGKSDSTLCRGDSLMLWVIGGTLGTDAFWHWYDDSCGGNFITTGDTIVTTINSSGKYYVRAEGSCNWSSCAETLVDILEDAELFGLSSSSGGAVCPGIAVLLTTEGKGSEAVWYAGSCGSVPIGTGDSLWVNPTVTTTYWAQWLSLCSASRCDSVLVEVQSLSVTPDSISVSADTICNGNSSVLHVSGGNNGGGSWYWSTGSCLSTLIGSGDSIEVTPSATTTYYVRSLGICNASSCVSRTVSVNDVPALLISSPSSNPVCFGDSVELTIDNEIDSQYHSAIVWYVNGAAVGQGLSFRYLASDNDTIQAILDLSAYCRTGNQIGGQLHTISVLPLPELNAQLSHPTSFGGTDGSINLTVTAGTGSYSYSWSNGAVTEDLSQLSAGSYSVTVDDEHGCNAAASFVMVYTEPCPEIDSLWIANLGSQTVELHWSGTVNAQSYEIRGGIQGSSQNVTLSVNANQLSRAISGLEAARSYWWQIRAICDASNNSLADWSSIDSFTTICAAPAPIFHGLVNQTSARLNWTLVDGAIGYQIKGRELTGSWVQVNLNSGVTSYFNTGNILRPTTWYEWKIRSVCENGGYSEFTTRDVFTTLPASAKSRSQENSAAINNERFWFDVYPNPSDGLLHLKFSHMAAKIIHLTLLDYTGNQVWEESLRISEERPLIVKDFSMVQSGVYMLVVKSSDAQFSKRVVISD